MELLPNENIIKEYSGIGFTITNMRIFREVKTWFYSAIECIDLKDICCCSFVRSRYYVFLKAAILFSLLIVAGYLLRDTIEKFNIINFTVLQILFACGAVYYLYKFITRLEFKLLINSANGSIDITIGHMSTDDAIDIINKIEELRLKI
jgi:hypothetical protein